MESTIKNGNGKYKYFNEFNGKYKYFFVVKIFALKNFKINIHQKVF